MNLKNILSQFSPSDYVQIAGIIISLICSLIAIFISVKTLKQNFLVFRGTRDEVDAAPGIDRCWYLAWDTGELFVGNSVGTKTKYGGNAKTMSKADIIDFVNEQFIPILQINNNTINEIKKESTGSRRQKLQKILGG